MKKNGLRSRLFGFLKKSPLPEEKEFLSEEEKYPLSEGWIEGEDLQKIFSDIQEKVRDGFSYDFKKGEWKK